MNVQKNYRVIFAARLREARGSLTVDAVSKATGIPQSTITRYENNRREIGLENLCKLADFYQEDLNYLTGMKDF